VRQDDLAGEFTPPLISILALCLWLHLLPNLVKNFVEDLDQFHHCFGVRTPIRSDPLRSIVPYLLTVGRTVWFLGTFTVPSRLKFTAD
jgi:hypothetical protein